MITDEQVIAAARALYVGAAVLTDEQIAVSIANGGFNRLRSALEAAEKAAWLPISEAESGRIVLASYRNDLGKQRTVKAVFYKQFSREFDHDFDELEGEYSQEKDAYFWPEGWYECIENWDSFSHVTMPTPTHFRPLPKGPSDDKA